MVDTFALDCWMQNVLGARSEVATVEIPERLGRAHMRRLVRTVSCIDRLLAFE